MTAPTDAFAAIAQRSQEATTAAVQNWTETVTAYTTSFSAEHPLPKPADVHAAVGTWFDLATSLLTEQRAFATTMVDAGSDATERASAAAAQFAPKKG
jgi:hypothetical protein